MAVDAATDGWVPAEVTYPGTEKIVVDVCLAMFAFLVVIQIFLVLPLSGWVLPR